MADLPQELLAIISGGLRNPIDTIRFRSVCRSWRFSTPPPAPFFPLKLPHTIFQLHREPTIEASTVCLLRSRHDPSKAWMVSVEESVTGKLVLRHALTYKKIALVSWEDLWSDDWFVAQVLARSHSHKSICECCNGVKRTMKGVFVTNSEIGCSFQLAGLCQIECGESAFFRLNSNGGPAREIKLDGTRFDRPQFKDFVKFKGGIYGIRSGYLYLVDHEKTRLLHINQPTEALPSGCMWLVVSDGDLYVVSSPDLVSFTTYRLVIKDQSNGMITGVEWEEVGDLGERVFFLAMNCSFSVSARDLPRPWKGNCIVYFHWYGGFCCDEQQASKYIYIIFEGRRRRPMSGLQGYSNLFDPIPSIFSS